MRKIVVDILAWGLVAAATAAATLVFAPYNHGQAEFVIEKGESLLTIARRLDSQNLIRNRYLFVGYAILTGQEKRFQAGSYIVPARASSRDIARIFAQGLAQPDDVAVTIPEGSNVAEIDRILAKAGLIKDGDLLGSGLTELEGYLFPDTYRFSKQLTENSKQAVDEIAVKMRENFKDKTEEFKSLKFKDAVTIASMLEKEVKTAQDMRLVAGIIEKRLELGMPLEIDATVAYGVCRQEWRQTPSLNISTFKYCDVSQVNLVDNIPRDSEYNTYTRTGLPAGAISNPGLKAIKAALNPEPSDYLYYLSAKDGTTIFSKTAAEHAKARRKYLGK